MTLYVYEIETMKIVAKYEGNTIEECVSQYENSPYTDTDIYANSTAPAFGCVDGLHY